MPSIRVKNLTDGRIFRLEADSRCVPFPVDDPAARPQVLSVESSFEDLRCVHYSTSMGLGGYVASESRLSSRLPGEVVIVRTMEGRRERWLTVAILPDEVAAEPRAAGR